MKNLFYNLGLLLFGVLQTYIAYMTIAMTVMADENSLVVTIVFWVVFVGAAFLDKLLRGVEGWWQILLCLIVSPLRGLIQFVMVILTVVNLCRRAEPVCKRGKYNKYRVLSIVIYIATGLNISKQASAAEQAAAKARLAAIQKNSSEKPKSRKQQTYDKLLADDPHYFDLGTNLKKHMPIAGHMSNSGARVRDENVKISYNDAYTEMQISYTAEVYPLGSDSKTIKAAWKYYYDACLDLQKSVNLSASSHIQSYIRNYPFKGKVKWSVNVSIYKADF